MSDPTIFFAGFDFLASKGCRACRHVMDGAPVLLFVHEADGSLQMLCGANDHEEADSVWVHVAHVIDSQPDLLDLPHVGFGHEAERTAGHSPWHVSPTPA